MLNINSLSKTYAQADGDIQVLNQLDLLIDRGQTAALLGESGSGKSTLLNLIAGLDRPDGGEITVAGQTTKNLSDHAWNELRRSQLGLVFQQYHLVPTLNVADNIQLQARLARRVDDAFAQFLIDQLGLSALLKRLPDQLSGGQQQRVAIARALMHKPKLVLADEPTGNLDERTSEKVMEVFVQLVKETECSLLMVTHSQTMANFLDLRFRLHQGRIEPSEHIENNPL